MSNVARCSFIGGSNDNLTMYGAPNELYLLPILCPKNTKYPKHYFFDGAFRMYEVYSRKKLRVGSVNDIATYEYRGTINKDNIHLIKEVRG